MTSELLQIKFISDRDLVLARQRAGEIAGLIGFDSHEQTRMATAVSEAVRNCVNHGGVDQIDFVIRDTDRGALFEIRIRTSRIEPSRVNLILTRTDTSEGVLATGMAAAKRLIDRFTVEPDAGGGSTIALGRFLPRGIRISTSDARRIAEQIARRTPRDAIEEVRQQNQELVIVLEEVRKRQEELVQLNRELEDTNRGVLALHTELEQRSEQLYRANELKTRFISEMSHEFRTPINSILSLCQILMAKIDGELTPEQEKQVGFVKKSAEDLSNLVNDLLDLAKIEAGKIDVYPSEFEIANVLGALRGVLRPLITTDAVQLVFEEPSGLPPLYSDEGKVGQILRNLIFNAIKFTEQGEVRVSAALDKDREAIVFSVADTGIGMSQEEQDMIFQEFVQLRGPVQKRVKGTGLGLPLSRKLAELLGGSISYESRIGEGTTFWATIPIQYEEAATRKREPKVPTKPDAETKLVLIIEDDPESIVIYRKFLHNAGFQVVSAATFSEARDILRRLKPAAIILDILFDGEPDGWEFLAELKGTKATKDIPMFVITVLEDRERAMLLGASDFCVKPIDREDLLERLTDLLHVKKVLIIDDEEVSRYILRNLLPEARYTVIEAESGEEGLARAIAEKPDVILLDLVMPGMSGFEVLAVLKADPRTKDIPVIIVTAKRLDEQERQELKKAAVKVLSKHAGSREQTIGQLSTVLAKIDC